MSRILWLAFERPPHPDAVCHPATVGDALFVLELLEAPIDHRERVAGQLRRDLEQQTRCAPWQRPAIPCRRESGLYALIPWRLARWLSVVLPATSGVTERTRQRIEHWLQHGTASPSVCNPAVRSA